MKNLKSCLVTLFLSASLLCGLNSSAQHIKILPEYEYLSDTSVARFISRLQYVLVKRDAAQLKKMIAPDIHWSFGAEWGIDSFWKNWNPESKDSEIWEQMSLLLSKGGKKSAYFSAKDSLSYTFPTEYFYTIPDSLSSKFDAMSIITLWADNVNVREKPNTGSKILATVSHEIYMYDNSVIDPPEGWTPVISLDGKIKGFVKSEFGRSAFDYRMTVSKHSGEWKIVMLINGD